MGYGKNNVKPSTRPYGPADYRLDGTCDGFTSWWSLIPMGTKTA